MKTYALSTVSSLPESSILTIQQNSPTDPVADAWTIYSSRRWKTNIQTMDSALEIVRQLRGVTFDWKATGQHDIGLVAEEVGQVIPEIVAYEDNGVDAKSIDYNRLVAVLIEAVKEQQNQIEVQQVRIAEMETRLTALESASSMGGITHQPLADRLAESWPLMAALLLVGLVVGSRSLLRLQR